MPDSPRSPRNKSSSLKDISPKIPTSLSTNRCRLLPEEICVGCIVWLPEPENNSPTIYSLTTGRALDSSGYGHPVVVTHVKQKSGSHERNDLVVTIATITSFNNLSLTNFNESRNSSRRRKSLPILSRGGKDDKGKALNLEGNTPLAKQSYVRLESIYDVPLTLLRGFAFGKRSRATDRRLDKSSYTVLMGELGLEPQEYVPSDMVWQTASTRLAFLAYPCHDWAEGQYPGSAGPASSQKAQYSSSGILPNTALPMPRQPDLEVDYTPPMPTHSIAHSYHRNTQYNNHLPNDSVQSYQANDGMSPNLPPSTPHCTTRGNCRPFGSVLRKWNWVLGKIMWVANRWLQVLIGASSCLLVGYAVSKFWSM